MPELTLSLTVQCPWCKQGETLADQSADIRISCRCDICHRIYRIDFRTMQAFRAKAAPKVRKHVKAV